MGMKSHAPSLGECNLGSVTRADQSKQPLAVSKMFDDVAQRYDLTNDVLSMGQAARWRKAVVKAVDPQPGERILDLAAGTGTSTRPFKDAGAEPIACDFSPGMIEVGRERQPDLEFVEGDATNLPFEDNTFDASTISFGLRNVVEPKQGLSEMFRVTKPGGRIVVCEFSHPTNDLVRKAYLEYLMKALPEVAKATSSNPDAYVYLAESIVAWPNQQELSTWLQGAGWENVQWRDLSGGIVALHRAIKP